MLRRWLVKSLYIQVIKVYFWGGSGRNGCLLISFGKLFSTIFEGLKKIYHYSAKVFSTKRKKFFIGLKKFCQAYKKIYLSSSKLQFAELQIGICKAPNSSLDKGKLVFGYKQIDANRDVPLCRHDGLFARKSTRKFDTP